MKRSGGWTKFKKITWFGLLYATSICHTLDISWVKN